MMDFSFSVHFQKHLGGDGEKPSSLSKQFPGEREWCLGNLCTWASFYKLGRGRSITQGNGQSTCPPSLWELIHIITNIYCLLFARPVASAEDTAASPEPCMLSSRLMNRKSGFKLETDSPLIWGERKCGFFF